MKPEYVASEDLVIGERYRAELQDCCIAGKFTARLVSISKDLEEDDEFAYVTRLEFDNGVVLDEFMQVGFVPVPDDVPSS